MRLYKASRISAPRGALRLTALARPRRGLLHQCTEPLGAPPESALNSCSTSTASKR